MVDVGLSDEQLERYRRHILLPNVGVKGQKTILASKILIIGTGGLGSPIAMYLAAAGVGTLGIVDGDVVDCSNLHRQIIHSTTDIGRSKVDSAEETIKAINPDVKVIKYNTRVTSSNIIDVINEYDFIIDGTDNFPSKFLINDACVLAGKPYSHGGILQFQGQTMTVLPGETTCYRCVFLHPPLPDAVLNCRESGVLGPIAGMLGTIQATEALKYVLGVGKLLTNTLMTFDALDMRFRSASVPRNRNCPICSKHPTITTLIDY
ncbi:MAG: adenylyltransferase [Candidatus Margulisiibacteriota bacterium]|nr:MAG: adenylyltransferase [Candidatus Margulisbacteria bacterium GWD2_39_127]OGI04236.1 MAG: adenylyltransferase [Candidatus Margulisbacteria bacterium GWF2_38_17]OGI07716.1 MAG: adenylyltransferase [Candidatus Margulisbacteria bacterium GWE2_39_32]PZM79662.1 MAG: adenylyltransferase [Candidatus Margulisiibacteriota bacterium]HAR62657.1 adenylyltransferase [Candidatus Margulisiibacteriota bacterium]